MSLLLSLCVLTCPGLFSSRHLSVFFFTVCIGVRAGGARGAAAPPKVWATQIFWAARENLGKASF